MKQMNNKPDRMQHRMTGLILFLMTIFIASQLLIQKNVLADSYDYQKYMEKSVIPNGATKLVLHDLGIARPNLSEGYEVYSKETKAKLTTELTSLKFAAASQNKKNGIKLDITEYLKAGSSGSTFGCSMQTQVENWTDTKNRTNKSELYFEVYDKDGKLKTKKLLGSIMPDQDNKNLTTREAKIGPNWSYKLLKGEAVLNFKATDRVYICVTQKNPVQSYDRVFVWFYDNTENYGLSEALSKPVLNMAGDAIELSLENRTEANQTYNFLLQSYQNDVLMNESLHTKDIPAGSDGTKVQIPAKPGDIISIFDENGKYYAKDYELRENIWVGTWGSAQLTASGTTLPPKPGLSGNTYRQSVRVSTGGNLLRIKFSNEYGTTPLEINSAYIAHLLEYGSSKIDPATNTLVTFNGGSRRVTIPAGKTVTSDAISFQFDALDYIAISTLFGKVPNVITSHTASRSTNCLMQGNHVKDEVFKNYQIATSWYFLSDIDVFTTPEHVSVVCFGDSLTDGYGVKTNVIQRWSDILAERLQEDPDTQHISVINKGIGGNSIYGGNGPAAYKRFVRDICEPAGVKYCILLIGVNDIGYASGDISASLISKYKEMIETAHKYGIKVYGGTITPFEGNGYYSVLHEQIRLKVNKWIMSKDSGFDGVIDFASAIADSAKPSKMQARFANDYLHPNAEGYAFLAEVIDLSLFMDQE